MRFSTRGSSSGFARDRTVLLLRESAGDISEDTFWQLISAIEGLELPRVQKMIVNEEYAQGMQMEAREQEGGVSMRNKWRPSRTRAAPPAPPDYVAVNASDNAIDPPLTAESARAAALDDELLPADLAVLKTLPPYAKRRPHKAA